MQLEAQQNRLKPFERLGMQINTDVCNPLELLTNKLMREQIIYSLTAYSVGEFQPYWEHFGETSVTFLPV